MAEIEFLTIDEAAALLRRSRRAIGELVARRAIPHRRMAGARRLLFPKGELLAWLDGAPLEVIETRGARIVKAIA